MRFLGSDLGAARLARRRPDMKNVIRELRAQRGWSQAALADFASRAYRRPLADAEKAELPRLYQGLREKGEAHDAAFRAILGNRWRSSPKPMRRRNSPAAAVI